MISVYLLLDYWKSCLFYKTTLSCHNFISSCIILTTSFRGFTSLFLFVISANSWRKTNIELNLLENNGYATSLFEEYVDDIIIESAIMKNKDYFINISPIENYIEIAIDCENEGEYEVIEIKKYKNVKSAFNYIKKHMEE